MKKIFLFAFVLGGVLTGCTSADDLVLPATEEEEYSATRTEKEMIAIAEEAPALFDEVQSRSSRHASKHLIPVSTSKSRNEDEADIYAINFEDNQGFVLVTDCRRIDGLLAYVPEGSYSDALLENPAFATIVRPPITYDTTIHAEPYPGLPQPNPDPDPNPGDDDDDGKLKRKILETKTTKTVLENYPKKVYSRWGQGMPANLYFPNYVAGCGPVAVGQAMSYIKPPYMNLSFPGADVSKVVFNWSDISKHYYDHESYFEDCQATPEAHKQIAYLCREIAHRANAEYEFLATGTTPNGLYIALMSLFAGFCDISSPVVYSTAAEFENKLRTDVCILIASDSYSNYARHAFIADGFKVVKIYEVCKWRYEDDLLWHILWENEKTQTYYHINWGWSGDGNGYFSRDLLNPSRPEEIEAGVDPSDINANYNKDKVYISIHKTN